MDWLNGLFQSVGPMLGNLFGGGGGAAGAGGKTAGGATAGGGGFLNGLFPGGTTPGMAGLGALGLGQAMQPKINGPDFNGLQSVQNLRNFNNSPHSLDTAVQQSIQNSLNIQNEQQLRNLRDTYKNARPGTDYTTDSAYQRDLANLNHSMAQDSSDVMANASLASNQQRLGNLTNIAGLDAQGAMAKYGMKAQKAQNQNQMFGNLGSMFLQKGLGMPDYSGLAGLFGGHKKAGQQ